MGQSFQDIILGIGQGFIIKPGNVKWRIYIYIYIYKIGEIIVNNQNYKCIFAIISFDVHFNTTFICHQYQLTRNALQGLERELSVLSLIGKGFLLFWFLLTSLYVDCCINSTKVRLYKMWWIPVNETGRTCLFDINFRKSITWNSCLCRLNMLK